MSDQSGSAPDIGALCRNLRFLVVDDFEAFRRSMKQMLRAIGAENIDTAANGREAVYKCTYDRFDVVVCDYNLGDGKNGQQVLEELRFKKLLKRTSLFTMVTAENSKEMVMGARESQPDTYITKPVTRAVLQQRLGALLEQRLALLEINKEADLENLPKAITLCEQALPELPRYRNWLIRNMADFYQQTGDYAHAKKIYEDALKGRELPWARLGLCRVLLAEAQLDEAATQLTSAIAADKNFLEAYDLLAEVQRRQGKLKQAQKTLEDAARLSPNGIVRQETIAQIAQDNQDFEAAASALRNTVRLGVGSVHDKPDHFLELGRCLFEISDGDTGEQGRKAADEALNVITSMGKRFREDGYSKTLGTLISARVHAGQGREQESARLIEELGAHLDADDMTADMGLELAKTLYSQHKDNEAETLLSRLATRFEADAEVMAKIEALMDEPVGFQKKMRARGLTKDGIKAFEQGQLEVAIRIFEDALQLIPRHPALNLNLIQVLLKKMEQGDTSPGLLKRCKSCLEQAAHIPAQHRQHKRLVFLQNKIDNLARTAQKQGSQS